MRRMQTPDCHHFHATWAGKVAPSTVTLMLTPDLQTAAVPGSDRAVNLLSWLLVLFTLAKRAWAVNMLLAKSLSGNSAVN